MWPFKKKNKELRNCLHPDYIGKTEPAFRARGIQYYRFKQEIEMPYGRYKEVSAFLHEVSLKMDLKTLRAYLAEIKGFLDGSRGQANLGEIWKIIFKMESRIELAFEPESAKRLASVIYFDETESLESFDREYGQKKLKIWEAEGSYDFFLTRPMAELLGLNGISMDSLIDYIKEAGEVIAASILEQPKA